MALMETLGVGFALGDAKTGTIAACPGYADILGVDVAGAIGLAMEDVTHPDDIKVNRWLLDQSLGALGGFTVRKRYIRANGEIQWVENRVLALTGGGMANVMLASRRIHLPSAKALEIPPAEFCADYVAQMAGQLAQMASRARLDDAADLLRLAAEAAAAR